MFILTEKNQAAATPDRQAQSVTAFPVLFSTLIPQNIAQPSRRQVS